jgi:DNA processing protein
VNGQRQLLAENNSGETSLPEGPQTIVGRELLASLKPDSSVHLDALLETLQYHSSSEVIAALFELEMLGLVKQLPGKNFVKVW